MTAEKWVFEWLGILTFLELKSLCCFVVKHMRIFTIWCSFCDHFAPTCIITYEILFTNLMQFASWLFWTDWLFAPTGWSLFTYLCHLCTHQMFWVGGCYNVKASNKVLPSSLSLCEWVVATMPKLPTRYCILHCPSMSLYFFLKCPFFFFSLPEFFENAMPFPPP